MSEGEDTGTPSNDEVEAVEPTPRSPLVSDEEAAVLREAFEAARSGPTFLEDGVDLASPDRALRAHMARVEPYLGAFAQQVRRRAPRLLGCGLKVEHERLDATPAMALLDNMTPGGAVVVLRGDDGAVGALLIGPATLSFIVNRRLGTPSAQAAKPGASRSQPTELDLRLARGFAEAILGAVEATMSGAIRPLRIDTIHERARDATAALGGRSVLRFGARLRFSDEVREALVIGVSVEALRNAPARPRGDAPTDTERTRLLHAMSRSEVAVSAVIGRTRARAASVASLRAGETLWLGSNDGSRAELCVAGTPKWLGRPLVHGGVLAISIEGLSEHASIPTSTPQEGRAR